MSVLNLNQVSKLFLGGQALSGLYKGPNKIWTPRDEYADLILATPDLLSYSLCHKLDRFVNERSGVAGVLGPEGTSPPTEGPPLRKGAKGSYTFSANNTGSVPQQLAQPSVTIAQIKVIEAWMTSRAENTNAFGVALASTTNASPIFSIGTTTATQADLYGRTSAGTGGNHKGPVINNDGKAHHVVGMWDYGTTISRIALYVDGVNVFEGVQTGATALNSIRIGGRRHNVVPGTNRWLGDVSDVAFYSRLLTDSEILAHYNAGKS